MISVPIFRIIEEREREREVNFSVELFQIFYFYFFVSPTSTLPAILQDLILITFIIRSRMIKDRYEPLHDKTNKITSAPSEDSDQPGHPPSLIRVFVVRFMGS